MPDLANGSQIGADSRNLASQANPGCPDRCQIWPMVRRPGQPRAIWYAEQAPVAQIDARTGQRFPDLSSLTRSGSPSKPQRADRRQIWRMVLRSWQPHAIWRPKQTPVAQIDARSGQWFPDRSGLTRSGIPSKPQLPRSRPDLANDSHIGAALRNVAPRATPSCPDQCQIWPMVHRSEQSRAIWHPKQAPIAQVDARSGQ